MYAITLKVPTQKKVFLLNCYILRRLNGEKTPFSTLWRFRHQLLTDGSQRNILSNKIGCFFGILYSIYNNNRNEKKQKIMKT